MTVVRSPDTWRALERVTALSTLIRQRHLTPSCGGHAPTAERTVGPARIGLENLTPRPGIREQHRSKAALGATRGHFRLATISRCRYVLANPEISHVIQLVSTIDIEGAAQYV